MRLFFATDLHGSSRCFKKFVAAKAFYHADVLVLGGDLTGKAVVPLYSESGRAHYSLYGRDFTCAGPREIARAHETIRNLGFYPLDLGTHETHHLEEQTEFDRRYRRLVENQLDEWDGIATSAGVQIFTIPGNDDPVFVDSLLAASRSFQSCDRRAVPLMDGWTILGFGGSNKTPWNTAREYSEIDIERALDSVMSRVDDPTRSIWNVHVPPQGSGLDVCEALDERFQVITRLGAPELHSAGSVAVKQLLTKWRPPVALFGHIHEGRGWKRIGDTLCVNPGSEYYLGVLGGCTIDIRHGKVVNFQLTRG